MKIKLTELFFKSSSQDYSGLRLPEVYLGKGCFIQKYLNGRYYFLPLGMLVFNKTLNLLRKCMQGIGAQESSIPLFHLNDLRVESKREQIEDLFTKDLRDREGDIYNLAASPEEMYLNLLRQYDISSDDLPLILFQFGKKFRDEDHTQYLLRLKEFTMMDAYSFHTNEENFKETYDNISRIYLEFFNKLGLQAKKVSSYNSLAVGSYAHEFMLDSEVGEGTYLEAVDGSYIAHTDIAKFRKDNEGGYLSTSGKKLNMKTGIELGNIYQVGDFFTSKMKNATYLGHNGMSNAFYMGAYSMGIERLIASIVEKNHDSKGVIWPADITPYDIYIIPDSPDGNSADISEDKICKELELNFDILYDDRNKVSTETKLKDAYLIGCPYIITFKGKEPKDDLCTVIIRKDSSKKRIAVKNLNDYLGSLNQQI